MSLIKPFKALRPSAEMAEKVIAPPYDVLNSKEARDMAKDMPYSFLHISKPEIDLDESIKFNDEKVYEKGAENLEKFINEKILFQDKEDCLYLYEISLDGITQTGFGCIASIDAYDKNIIKKHEYTTPIKEDDRVLNITKLKAQTGPVLLTYKKNDQLHHILKESKEDQPIYNVKAHDSSIHKIWLINENKKIEKIVNEVNSIGTLFIADGHHRSAAASRVRKKLLEDKNNTEKENINYFLAVAFPHDEMNILDYNRVVNGLNGYSKDSFIKKLCENFVVKEVNETFKPSARNHFGMYLKGSWYHLSLKEGEDTLHHPVKSLDVSILHDLIIAPLLDIKDERRDNRINFIGGARGLKELEKKVNQEKYDIAFSLFPTPIESLIAVAEANKVMPPKSTWFEPKLLDGLISHKLY